MQVSMWLDELGDSWNIYQYFRWACDILQYFYRRKMDIPRKIEKCKGIYLQEICDAHVQLLIDSDLYVLSMSTNEALRDVGMSQS